MEGSERPGLGHARDPGHLHDNTWRSLVPAGFSLARHRAFLLCTAPLRAHCTLPKKLKEPNGGSAHTPVPAMSGEEAAMSRHERPGPRPPNDTKARELKPPQAPSPRPGRNSPINLSRSGCLELDTIEIQATWTFLIVEALNRRLLGTAGKDLGGEQRVCILIVMHPMHSTTNTKSMQGCQEKYGLNMEGARAVVEALKLSSTSCFGRRAGNQVCGIHSLHAQSPIFTHPIIELKIVTVRVMRALPLLYTGGTGERSRNGYPKA